jgi:hypothetical protein
VAFYDAWTSDEIGKLKKLFRAGFTRKQISAEIGRPIGGIDKKLTDLGLVSRRKLDRKDVVSLPTDHTEHLEFTRECAAANDRFCEAMARAYGVQPSEPSKALKKSYARVVHLPGHVPGASSLE